MRLSVRERQGLSLLVTLGIIWLAIQIAGSVWSAIESIMDVILIFVVAWSVAYLIAPLVARIEARVPFGRAGAVGVIYLALGVVLAGTLATVVPGLVAQLADAAQRGPEYGERAAAMVSELQAWLQRLGVGVDLNQAYGTLPARLGDLTGSFATNALRYVTRAAGLILDVVIVLIIAFIMLIDGNSLWGRFTRALSEELRSEAELFRASTDKAFGGFIRGSLLVGLTYGVLTFLTLAPLGVPYSGVLALVAGVASVIPFFGPIIAMVPIVVITLLGTPDRLAVVVLLTLGIQQVMFNVVSPRILSSSVGVHPLFVFAALLVGSKLGGFWGVFLALPIAGIGAVFLRYGYEIARGRRTRTEAAGLIVDGKRSAT